jgi:TP901 family phage tail tape measure protein
MALRSIGVRLTAEVTGFTTRMKAAEQSVKSFHKELQDKASSGHLDKLADSAGVMGLGLAAGFGYAVKAAADFDKQMSAVSAATHANVGDMKALRAAALQAGKDTQYSATQAAQGVTELAKAGVATASILGGGLKGALTLAAAGQLDVGEAAETAASAMTQFKLSGDKVPHVADLLAAAAGKAQGSVHDMGQALNQAGLIASQTGLTIEETTGGLAAFASAGLTGSDAGTSFKQMLLMLQAPSEKTQGLMDELGISLYDNQGKFIGLSKFAGQLQEKLKGLTPQARAAAMAQIFGADATRAASIMYENGSAGIQKWIDKVNETGYAQKTASQLTDNLAGDVERLKGSLETMAIEAGGGANSGLRVLVKLLNGIVDTLGNMNPLVTSGAVVLAGLTGALLLGFAAWVKYRRAVQETREQLETLGPAGAKASTAIGKLSALAGAIGTWSLALETGAAILNSIGDKSADVDKLTDSITNLVSTGKSAGEINNVFGDNFKDLDQIAAFANEANSGFGKFLNTTVAGIPVIGDAGAALGNFVNRMAFGTDAKQATEQLGSLDSSLVAFMNSTHDATKASDLWNQILSKSGLNTEELARLMPNAYKQLGVLNTESMRSKDSLGILSTAVDDSKVAQQKFATAAEAAAGAMRGERAAFGELSAAMKAETDPVFGLLDAQQKLTAAQKAASKAIKDHGKNSAEAKEATRNLALAAIDLQEKAGAVSATFDGKMSPSLRATLKAAHLTDAQIAELSAQFTEAKDRATEYDGDYKATASAPGAMQSEAQIKAAKKAADAFDDSYNAYLKTPNSKNAQTAIDKAWTALKGYDGNWVAHISTKGYDGVANDLRHLLAAQKALKENTTVNEANRELGHFMASGGPVVGPGSGTSDSINARLSNGEYVIRADAVKKVGVGALNHVNATGEMPRAFATGGVVMPYPTNVKGTKIPAAQAMDMGGGGVAGGSFGNWPKSPGAQRGDSGIWRKIVALVKSSGIPYDFGNGYRPGDPLWHGCVPMDTLILTRRGWIKHDDVQVGEDETVGYNPATGKNEWTLIVGMNRYDDAEVWKIGNTWFEAEVTPGHKWLVDQPVSVQTETVCTECGQEFTTGRGMTTHRGHVHQVYTPRAERYEEQLVETRDFKQNTRLHLSKPAELGVDLPISDPEAELIGWIMADGYMEPYGPTIVQSKPQQVEYLRAFMEQFPHSVYVRKPEGRQNHEVYRFRLAHEFWEDLRHRSEASKAEAVDFVLSMSTSQREAWLRGFLAGDGTRDPRTQDERLGFSAFQVSGPVAEAVKIAAYLEGYRPDVRVKTEFDADRFGTQPMEHVGLRTPTTKARHLKRLAVRQAEVWCPTTTLGTWTARQGEEIFLTGNSGRAVDFMGFNQDRLAQFFMARQGSVLELIHRSKSHDYGLTRGRLHAMPHQWPLHKNHLHVAMKNGGVINEHVLGVGRSGTTYELGEAGPERVTPMRGYASGGLVNIAASTSSPAVSARGSRLDTANAMLQASDAVDQLTASLKANGRSWSTATAKGRENRSSLISGVRAAQDAAKAKYAETGSIKAANKVYADYIKALSDSMAKMKVNYATRKALLKAYSEQPQYDIAAPSAKAPSNSSGRVAMVSDQIGVEQALTATKSAFAWSTPTFNVKTATGQAELQQLFSFLSAAQAAAQSSFDYNGNAKDATNYYNGYLTQLRSVLSASGLSKSRIDDLLKAYGRITLTPKSNRWGGLYDFAADGVLRDAKAASAGSTLYGWREPSTGGELFAPKNGNLAKTRSEVGWAVSNWWGGKVNWQPGNTGAAAAGRTVVVNATIPITLGSEVITYQVRAEVDTALGQVANAAVYQTA